MLIITVLALLMAATMAWLAVRLLREEQRRSGARIAALAAALDTPSPVLVAEDAAVPTGSSTLARTRFGARDAAPEVTPVRVPELVPLDDSRPELDFASEERRPDVPTAHDTAPTLERPMFGQTGEPPTDADAGNVGPARDLFGGVDANPRSDDRRWLAVAAVVMVFLLGGAALWSLSGGTDSAASPATRAAAANGIALELVALGHDQAGKVLLVRGLVRNPPAASARANTYVQVRLFDEGGTPLGSGRGVLDVPSLVPGDEAAFTVELPADPRVRRYRVTFREPDGNLVPHVDIRAASR